MARSARRWRDDLGRLASAANGGADRGGDAGRCSPRCSSRPGSRWRPDTATTVSPPASARRHVVPAAARSTASQRSNGLDSLIAWFTLVPGLIGVVLAAPFVLELENGTYRLAWTQSITRRRWIVTKLGLAVGTALVGGARADRPDDVVAHARSFASRAGWTPASYDAEGIVVFGYTLFALGVAPAVGVVWRRAVPALVVAFGVYFAARIFVDTWLRQRLVTPLTATWPLRRLTSGEHGPRLGDQRATDQQARSLRSTASVTAPAFTSAPTRGSKRSESASHNTASTRTRSTSPRAASGRFRESRPASSAGLRSCCSCSPPGGRINAPGRLDRRRGTTS